MTFTNKTARFVSFTSFANKCEDFENTKKIPRSLKREDNNVRSSASTANSYKKVSLKNKDARLSYKNRRSINKDWKDFNTQVYVTKW
jgi:hypothetical protein